MAVPETSVDEYDRFETGHDDVRFTREVLTMEPKTVAKPVQNPP
jgi:hypothetical protein